jgi:hypothetical protein
MPRLLPRGNLSFSSTNRRTCRPISLRPNLRAFHRVSARLRRPLRYSHSVHPSRNRQHQHRRRRLPQRASQIRSLNGAVRRRTPRRRCAATWDQRGCKDDTACVQLFFAIAASVQPAALGWCSHLPFQVGDRRPNALRRTPKFGESRFGKRIIGGGRENLSRRGAAASASTKATLRFSATSHHYAVWVASVALPVSFPTPAFRERGHRRLAGGLVSMRRAAYVVRTSSLVVRTSSLAVSPPPGSKLARMPKGLLSYPAWTGHGKTAPLPLHS